MEKQKEIKNRLGINIEQKIFIQVHSYFFAYFFISLNFEF
jgi:hypothetical protein